MHLTYEVKALHCALADRHPRRLANPPGRTGSTIAAERPNPSSGLPENALDLAYGNP
jgi:hypothetical protein